MLYYWYKQAERQKGYKMEAITKRYEAEYGYKPSLYELSLMYTGGELPIHEDSEEDELLSKLEEARLI